MPAGFSWTTFTETTEGDFQTRKVYVSSSGGSDSNDGLSELTPFKTLSRAQSEIRDGYPDWFLFKSGDTWTDESFRFNGSGLSRASPMLMSSYGTGARPKFVNAEFYNTVEGCNYHAIVGLHFDSTRSGPTNAIASLVAGTYLLIEDCFFENYHDNINIQGFMNEVRVRACILVDCWSSIANANGMYIAQTDDLLVEWCVFDHNGWSESEVGGEATIFNHNLYVQSNCSNVIVQDNIFARGASHGIQQRPGGTNQRNLYLQNGLGFLMGGGPGTCQDNVVLDGRDIDTLPRGFGCNIDECDTGTTEVFNNIIAHNVSGTAPIGMSLERLENLVNIHDNIVYDWSSPSVSSTALQFADGVTFAPGSLLQNNVFQCSQRRVVYYAESIDADLGLSGNVYYSPATESTWFTGVLETHDLAQWIAYTGESDASGSPVSYTDADRDIASYMATLGATQTLAAFLDAARLNSKSSWNDDYTATPVIDYIRAGFDMQPVGQSTTTSYALVFGSSALFFVT